MEIFEKLNDRQKESVNHIKGPMLIVAGAGSGKTLTLTCRVANLIKQGIAPYNILAVTFTNKAANEMKERIENILCDQTLTSKPLIGTFHSIGVRILRSEIEKLNRKKSFTILDADDAFALVRQIFKDFNISKERFHLRAILSRISLAKNNLLSSSDFLKNADDIFQQKVAEVFQEYEKRLIKINACDFDDLINLPVKIFQQFPEVLDKFQERWKFIMIDEFQDTNMVQNLFVSLLGAKYRNVCAIGDGDQSIYSFRGANVENILQFEKEFTPCKLIKLEQNYRSSSNILEGANAVIRHNKKRVDKKMFTKSGSGEKIMIFEADDEREEAHQICQEILNLKNKNKQNFSDFTVLYRTNAQSRNLEEAAMRFSLPYQIIGGIKFYARREIKDVLAYLKFIANEKDSVSFLRIINVPSRKIGKVSIARLQNFAQSKNLELSEILPHLSLAEGITPLAKKSLLNFADQIFALKKDVFQISAAELIIKIYEKFNLKNYYQDGSEEGEMRLENIKELISVAQKFDGLENSLNLFLENVALITDADNVPKNNDRVTFMTLHNAKGLQFETVFMAGAEENLLPHSQSLSSPQELEEERRLFYVGMTRAKKHLYICYAKSRLIFGNFSYNTPSRFLSEIPEKVCDFSNSNFHSAQKDTDITIEPIYDDLPQIIPEYNKGEKVIHPNFGEGEIEEVEGEVLTINFGKLGTKRFSASIAPLRKV